jgi:hypothetical protein
MKLTITIMNTLKCLEHVGHTFSGRTVETMTDLFKLLEDYEINYVFVEGFNVSASTLDFGIYYVEDDVVLVRTEWEDDVMRFHFFYCPTDKNRSEWPVESIKAVLMFD